MQAKRAHLGWIAVLACAATACVVVWWSLYVFAVMTAASGGPSKAFVVVALWGGVLLPAGLFLLIAFVFDVLALFLSTHRLSSGRWTPRWLDTAMWTVLGLIAGAPFAFFMGPWIVSHLSGP